MCLDVLSRTNHIFRMPMRRIQNKHVNTRLDKTGHTLQRR